MYRLLTCINLRYIYIYYNILLNQKKSPIYYQPQGLPKPKKNINKIII